MGRAAARERNIKEKRRTEKDLEGDVSMRRGVIYVGHLPHGFYEAQLKDYFSQFGTVTKVHVSRNKKVKDKNAMLYCVTSITWYMV